ncbi:MAG: hypothetical protein PT939_04930 [Aerococcus suis]|nr:hypothetical protein [Aerococcus suis]
MLKLVNKFKTLIDGRDNYVITVEFMDSKIQGQLSLTLQADGDKTDDELLELANEKIYSKISPEYSNKVVEEAKTISEEAKAISEAMQVKSETMDEELDSRLNEALAPVFERINGITERVIHIENLTKEQKEELNSKYSEWAPSVSYAIGDKVHYDGQNYEVVQAHTSQVDWKPDATPALYKVIQNDELEDGTEIINDFKKPQGAHDAYKKGDKVRFNGKVYTSVFDGANVWSPDELSQGWEEDD